MVLRFLGLGERAPAQIALETERLVLRSPVLEDFVEWSALRRGNRDFLQPWEPMWPRDHLTWKSWRRRVIWARRQARRRSTIVLLLCRRDDGEIIGGITISNIRGRPVRTATLGYWIGQKDARLGYMSEAVERVCAYSFGALDLMRVEAACLAENMASRALLTRCGFAYEGVVRAYLEVNGVVRDHLLFARVSRERENGTR